MDTAFDQPRRSRKPVWAVSSIEGSNPFLSAQRFVRGARRLRGGSTRVNAGLAAIGGLVPFSFPSRSLGGSAGRAGGTGRPALADRCGRASQGQHGSRRASVRTGSFHSLDSPAALGDLAIQPRTQGIDAEIARHKIADAEREALPGLADGPYGAATPTLAPSSAATTVSSAGSTNPRRVDGRTAQSMTTRRARSSPPGPPLTHPCASAEHHEQCGRDPAAAPGRRPAR
jgi:hypothetical protein